MSGERLVICGGTTGQQEDRNYDVADASMIHA
jgi:hypothetical protein